MGDVFAGTACLVSCLVMFVFASLNFTLATTNRPRVAPSSRKWAAFAAGFGWMASYQFALYAERYLNL